MSTVECERMFLFCFRDGNILSPRAVLTGLYESPWFILLTLQVYGRQEFNMQPMGEKSYGCWRGSIIERSQRVAELLLVSYMRSR